MALIKCPNCGKEASDKAVLCPECKTNLKEYREDQFNKEKQLAESKEYCPECKKMIDKGSTNCPVCGFPIQAEKDNMKVYNDKKKRNFIIAGVIAGIILLSVIIIVNIKNSSVENIIVGQWSSHNGESKWCFEFEEDFTGRFIGYHPGDIDEYNAVYYEFTWSYDKEKKRIDILDGDEEHNSFNVKDTSKNTITADFDSLSDEKRIKELDRDEFDYDQLVYDYGSLADRIINDLYQE